MRNEKRTQQNNNNINTIFMMDMVNCSSRIRSRRLSSSRILFTWHLHTWEREIIYLIEHWNMVINLYLLINELYRGELKSPLACGPRFDVFLHVKQSNELFLIIQIQSKFALEYIVKYWASDKMAPLLKLSSVKSNSSGVM